MPFLFLVRFAEILHRLHVFVKARVFFFFFSVMAALSRNPDDLKLTVGLNRQQQTVRYFILQLIVVY